MINERTNGEVAAKLASEIENILLENISLITRDMEKALTEKDEGENQANIPIKVGVELISTNGTSYDWDISLEWTRNKKSKAEKRHGNYNPDEPFLDTSMEKDAVNKRKKIPKE